jgi:hypothetical protein
MPQLRKLPAVHVSATLACAAIKASAGLSPCVIISSCIVSEAEHQPVACGNITSKGVVAVEAHVQAMHSAKLLCGAPSLQQRSAESARSFERTACAT